MNYEFHINKLETGETTSFRCIGNSMTPLIFTNSICTFQKQDEYEIGDIVL